MLPTLSRADQIVAWSSSQGQDLPFPHVTVSASSAVPVAPDRAIVYFELSTADTSPVVASSEVMALRRRVIDALTRQGVVAESVTTWGLGVGDQDEGRRLRGMPQMEAMERAYGARMGIRLVIDSLDRMEPIISAGLATNEVSVPLVIFKARDVTEARSEALAVATRAAASDAAAMARAAGGALGELLTMSSHYTNDYSDQLMTMYSGSGFGTPLHQNDVTVRVIVTASWRVQR